jgi:hypothetical protein
MPSNATVGYFANHRNHRLFRSWNDSWPFMASKKVPDLSAWIKEVNCGALISFETLRMHQVMALNPLAPTRHGRMAKLNVLMVHLASWFDASFIVMACQPNSGPLPLYIQYISITGCITRQLERRIMKDGQVSRSPTDFWRPCYGTLARKRPAKADRHTAHGVLLGFGSITKHVRYFDLTTNREKLSTHHVIDEAH